MRKIHFLPAVLLPILLAGCVEPGYRADGYYRDTSTPTYASQEAGQVQNVYYGYIVDVRPVELGRQNSPGIGAVLGAVIGGVVGNTVGGGTGRTLATVGGAVAGGYAGNSIQNAHDRKDAYQLTVRLDDGHDVSVVQEANEAFYRGDAVRVTGYGQNAHVTHR